MVSVLRRIFFMHESRVLPARTQVVDAVGRVCIEFREFLGQNLYWLELELQRNLNNRLVEIICLL